MFQVNPKLDLGFSVKVFESKVLMVVVLNATLV